MTAPALHVGAIWSRGSELVLVRRGRGPADGRWSLPGGAVDRGETMVEAVVRCVEADTGAAALCGPFVGWGEVPGPDAHVVTMFFDVVVVDERGLAVDGAPGPSGGDVSEVRSMAPWDITEIPLVDGLAEFLADQGIIELVV